ncbi:MAG: EthD domain-containing protein [Chitinophagaceae bacterium]|nr:EthD domain-containing protein [Chitinophagaceae bacterium]
MTKDVYVVQGNDTESYEGFKQRIFDAVSDIQIVLKPDAIKFTLTEKAPPSFSIIPFRKKKIAAISVYQSYPGPALLLKKIVGFRGAYRVEEVLPVSYNKNWKDGTLTPGVCLLTLFSQKKNITYETFIDRWHNSHTPLSLRIHPLWNYVRNEVKETLTENAPQFNGIVEEQVRVASDLLNPFKFFGNPLIIIPRMLTVYVDTKSFIDYPSMETYLTAEYIMKS